MRSGIGGGVLYTVAVHAVLCRAKTQAETRRKQRRVSP